jgi:hypothetical protein
MFSTFANANMKFTSDLSLINYSRVKSEQIIYTFCKVLDIEKS